MEAPEVATLPEEDADVKELQLKIESLGGGGDVLVALQLVQETGGLDVTLLKVADYSEEPLSRREGILGKLVESAIFVVVGGMVGFVYLAFFMAMLAVTRSVA